jgi:rod shape determining protein RodA
MISFSTRRIDWVLYLLTLPIVGAGLVTMYGFGSSENFFTKQIIAFLIATIVFLGIQLFDTHLFKRSNFLVFMYGFLIFLLAALFVIGKTANGAQSWFSLGGFSFQPAEFMKFVLILLLAKYFSKRHIEIKHIKHIAISGVYALIPIGLVILQPDFGSALALFLLWFGMTLVSGLSKKHLLFLIGAGVVIFVSLWVFFLKPYQKARITTFLNPVADVRGAGYNAHQSIIAVGSGTLFGKGVGFGTQSRLSYLPEYETDFIFAAFAEEWGFIGALIFLALFAILLYRITRITLHGQSNFDILVGTGVLIYFISHIAINIGMNIGLLPVTGNALPLMSFGGSHLIVEYALLGIVSKIRSEGRDAHREDLHNEFLGLE